MVFLRLERNNLQGLFKNRYGCNVKRRMVIAIGLLLFIMGSAYAHPLNDNSTNIRIADYLSSVNRPVFYIQIFGNDFPVPTRFEFRPNPGLLGIEAEFRSPSGYILKEQPLTGALNPNLLGSVYIGSYPGYIASLKEHPDLDSISDIVRSFKCYGLSVEVRKATAGVRAKIHQISVLIHNKNEFIDIVGRTDELPKRLLRLYGDLNRIEKGVGCTKW